MQRVCSRKTPRVLQILLIFNYVPSLPKISSLAGLGMVGSSADMLPPPAPAPPYWEYDVFVSFRGEDTRKGFMSHLFHEFEQNQILSYRDDDWDQRGLVLDTMLPKAIAGSRIALVVFSTHYADSSWCLDELVEIMNCADAYQGHGHMVVPVFYDVEPGDVRRQSGDFGKGFDSCLAEKGEAKAKVWRDALKGAGNRSGWHLRNDANGNESVLIEKIVGQIFCKTSFKKSPHFISDAVGIENRASKVISLLDIGTNDVRVVGLFGIKGIGKTTLARLVCSRVFSKFEGVSFLHSIGDSKHQSIVDFQKTLADDVLKMKGLKLQEDNWNWNVALIKAKFCQKKILLVLDDVTDKNQVMLLGGKRGTLGGGSRILITTEHERLLDDIKVDAKYMVSGLSCKDSLQLFCNYAFVKPEEGHEEGYEEGYEEVYKNLVHYTGGLPSAVKTLGACLLERTEDQWGKLLEKLVHKPDLDWVEAYSENEDSFLLPYDSMVGPYGGVGGVSYDDKAFTHIRQIRIVVVGPIVEAIYIDYDKNGSLVRSCRHGGPRDGHTHKLTIDYPDEFLTSVSGYITADRGLSIIQSLSVKSNRRKFGPYGVERGTPFSFDEKQIECGKILGFFGKCGCSVDSFFSGGRCSVDSIGAYYGLKQHPYPFKTIGPFGREEETSWDDGKHSDLRQIKVVVDSVIESISFIYDSYGHPTTPLQHGKQYKGKIHSVTLDYPYEYLTSISGYLREDHGKLILQSLSFKSNITIYGPFGEEIGIPFSGPSTGGKIVGFYGSCDSHLVSIGAYLEPVSHIHPVRSVGPFGGNGGGSWDDGRHSGLRKIIIRSGTVINSITCIYDEDGASVEQHRRGGGGGGNPQTVELDYPGEYIISISGYFGRKGSSSMTVVKSLTFQSNIRVHGPYGRESGTYFQSPSNIGKLVGFHGRSDAFLDSIGAYFAPVFHIDPIKTVGLYGGQVGDQWAWDDGKHTDIRSIFVSYGTVINGIACAYDETREPVLEEVHGGQGGGSHKIELDYPDEYLTSISGTAGDFQHMVVICSLEFRSNKRTFRRLGSPGPTPFSFTSSTGKIVGFFGQSSNYLHSIGAHLELLPNK